MLTWPAGAGRLHVQPHTLRPAPAPTVIAPAPVVEDVGTSDDGSIDFAARMRGLQGVCVVCCFLSYCDAL